MTAPPEATAASAPAPSSTPAHLGWRLLAMLYDLLPLVAIWFATSLIVYLVRGNHAAAPGSPGAWLMLGLLWLAAGAYFVLCWRRGGHTLGMRAWRLKVLAADGRIATAAALWRRFAVATTPVLALCAGWAISADARTAAAVSVLVAVVDAGWSLFDGERCTLHDLASGTRFVRMDDVI